MNVRAHVRANFPMAGFDLAVIRNTPAGTMERWVPVPGPAGAWLPFEPTLVDNDTWATFPGEIADAVLEAFERHVRSTNGYVPTDARADYLAERARVDKLADALVYIAQRTVDR